ncbi:uncharacterized protein LOC116936528 isoform X1 [Daphnia magna]|uniref:uncharacterized protein LOC116936528 isoform X1 n=1 Tax=Daphnia magna TaxID=35525 RepID=UPI001E1BB439|nr:uncharacterized protein LOC116936528 isoform X1 [Daphnia magna]
MKLIVILSIVYLSSANPVDVHSKPSGNRLQMIEQETLDHLTELVLALKSNDIPKHIGELPVSQLTGCITPLQRGIIKTCIFKSNCSNKSGNATLSDCSKMEIPTDKGHEDVSSDVVHHTTHSIFPMVIECVVGTLSPPGMVGFTNITYLKQGIIDTTSLSEEQRTSALPVLESCLSSTFTLPQINDMKQLSMKSGEGNSSTIAMKAMICAAKAILLNGCPAVVQTRMAEQQIQMSANVAVMTDNDSARSNKEVVDGNSSVCNKSMETPTKYSE